MQPFQVKMFTGHVAITGIFLLALMSWSKNNYSLAAVTGGEPETGITDDSRGQQEITSRKSNVGLDTHCNANVTEKRYHGCFDRWTGVLLEEFQTEFIMETRDPRHCLMQCLSKPAKGGGNYQVAMVKGHLCACTKWEFFKKNQISEAYCNFKCGQTAWPFVDESNSQNLACGGNLAVSAYCLATDPWCSISNGRMSPEIKNYDLKMLDDYKFAETVKASQQCMRCSEDEYVGWDNIKFSATFDYFPLNTPEACVLNCRRNLTSVYDGFVTAYLTWVSRYVEPIGSYNFPVCTCKEEYPSSGSCFVVDAIYCEAGCPGWNNSFNACGSRMSHTFISAYCTTVEKECKPMGGVEDPHWTPQDTSTKETSPNDLVGNGSSTLFPRTNSTNPDTASQSTVDAHSSEFPSSVSISPSTGVTSTRSVSAETSMNDAGISARDTTTSANEPSSHPTTVPGTQNCTIKCTTRFEGRTWNGCAGENVVRPCCKMGSIGNCSWLCLETGKFATPRPDVTNCTTSWFGDFNRTLEDAFVKHNNSLPKDEAFSMIKDLKDNCDPSNGNSLPYFGHEIKAISHIVMLIVQAAAGYSDVEFLLELVKGAVDLSGFLVANSEPWGELQLNGTLSCPMAGMELFHSLQQSVLALSKQIVEENYSTSFHSVAMSEDTFLVSYGTGSKSSSSELIFPDSKHSTYIQLGKGWEELAPKAEYVGYILDHSHYFHIFPASLNSLPIESSTGNFTKNFNSQLISLTIGGSDGSSEGVPYFPWPGGPVHWQSLNGNKAKITFGHLVDSWGSVPHTIPRRLHPDETAKTARSTARCVYWSEIEKKWSPEGCVLVSVSRTETVCECDHLTSFSVLMDVHNYVGKEYALEILTLILCPISLVCLLMSIVVFTTIESIRSRRTSITRNLCMCLAIGTMLMLLLVDRNYFHLSWTMCVIVGVVTHYTYLAAFMWMLVEGIHLYRLVVLVFNRGKSWSLIYSLFAYGTPLIIVSMTLGVGYGLGEEPYGGEMYCWLDGAYIYGFIVPVALIIIINIIILILAMRESHNIRAATESTRVRQLNSKTWIRGSLYITVLLGITWLPGFFMLSDSSVLGHIGGYLFVLLNASQGIFLFIFHCVLNEKVRRAASRNVSSFLSRSYSSGYQGKPYGRQRFYNDSDTSQSERI